MKRRTKDNANEPEEAEISEKEVKVGKRQAAKAKRLAAKRADALSRWSGLILLGLVLLVAFVLWVAGEMKNGDEPPTVPIEQQIPALPSPPVFQGVVVQ